METITIELDDELAMQFELLCNELGVSVESAITGFIRNAVEKGSI